MAIIDPTQTWVPVEERLARTTDARHRQMLGIVIEHMKAEAEPEIIAPALVVGRLLVPRRRLRVAIDLGQHEPCGVVRPLKHIEPGDTRLLHAGAGVEQRRGTERLDVFGNDMNLDMHDDHPPTLPQTPSRA